MSVLDVAAGVAVFLGAVIQSAVGFGFALMCAPLLFAALGARQAVGLANALAVVVNLVQLTGEGRRPEPLPAAWEVTLWSLPAMVAGVLILQGVDDRVLQFALTVTVFVALALRLRPVPQDAPAHPAPGWATPATGIGTGVLATTISTGGPPVVLLLLGRGHPPLRVRDTLAVVFLFQGLASLLVLAVSLGGDAVPPAAAALLFPLAVLGQIVGRRGFARLAASGHDRALTAVLMLSATVGLVAALT